MARRWMTRDQRRAAGVAAENDTFAREFGMAGWRERRDNQRRERLGAWRRPTNRQRLLLVMPMVSASSN